VIVTSHGGNIDPMKVVARELRVRHGMLAVTTAWRAFGLPQGTYADLDANHGIHAGDIETSLMLHFRPDLVDMSQAGRFDPLTIAMATSYKWLRPTGLHAFAWMAQDVNARARPATPASPRWRRARRRRPSRRRVLPKLADVREIPAGEAARG
jgi:creatinine amidohydrolase